MQYRIGQGQDFHKLIKGEDFILGGVNIPFEKGIKGHSDGDLVIHAIVDSLLGALALGDIGTYFPSEDKKWKNVDSRTFLEQVIELVSNNHYSISNIDCTVILQAPHINKYINQIKLNLANIMKISVSNISVKATTTDKLGFIGRGNGIGCTAICLLLSNHE
tara:strand:- start:919 stop:1404 length:486 start_codon:yes stop_codon:yes gene_type:complete